MQNGIANINLEKRLLRVLYKAVVTCGMKERQIIVRIVGQKWVKEDINNGVE